ncbi:TylF/MycF/NovP-related O-methyltransferase [Streptomyces sp. NPDC051776]|uniref:TylF/MycF/NovP-related O-methyltransferase n=1 Tax=Streptomyces sp. NPDC051776 TaxID=3155414 RepID=UPI0034228F3B
MSWKRRVNRHLGKLTGYELRRSSPPAPPAPQRPASPPPSGPELPADYDDETREIIGAVRPYTMTSPERLNALILACRYVARHRIPGSVVECGVWRGGSMQAAARTLASAGDTSRDLYLFDTFEGMPPPTEKDRRRDGEMASDLLARRGKDAPIWAVATLDDVRQGFEQVPYPKDRVHYVQGKVEDTVPSGAPEQIAILRLDTDWYASTRHELAHLYPRLVSGGVLLIDDYGWWQGSREAVDEFLEETGARLLLLRMDEGRIAVKP